MAERGARGFDGLISGRRRSDIKCHSMYPARRALLQFGNGGRHSVLAPRTDGHIRPLVSQTFGDCPPDAPCRSGDEDCVASKSEIHRSDEIHRQRQAVNGSQRLVRVNWAFAQRDCTVAGQQCVKFQSRKLPHRCDGCSQVAVRNCLQQEPSARKQGITRKEVGPDTTCDEVRAMSGAVAGRRQVTNSQVADRERVSICQ